MSPRPQTSLIIALTLLLLGCQTTQQVATATESAPPPDLTRRPWGLAAQVLELADKEDYAALGPYLVQPSEATLLGKQVAGMQRSRELVSPAGARVYLQKDGETGVLLFSRRSAGWLVESYQAVDPEPIDSTLAR